MTLGQALCRSIYTWDCHHPQLAKARASALSESASDCERYIPGMAALGSDSGRMCRILQGLQCAMSAVSSPNRATLAGTYRLDQTRLGCGYEFRKHRPLAGTFSGSTLLRSTTRSEPQHARAITRRGQSHAALPDNRLFSRRARPGAEPSPRRGGHPSWRGRAGRLVQPLPRHQAARSDEAGTRPPLP